jgi:hypothetical protein
VQRGNRLACAHATFAERRTSQVAQYWKLRFFERSGAVETPAIIGDGLDDGGFERSLQRERLKDALAMVVIGEAIFFGQVWIWPVNP